MIITVNGCALTVSDSGPRSGTPIVFLHAFPYSSTMWESQIAAVQQSRRVIAYDHRGQGRSEVGDGLYTLELLTDDLIAVLDHLQIPKAILCGISMGGYIALRAVERNADRVAGLVLCDTRSEADSNEAKLKRTEGLKAIAKDKQAYVQGFLKAALAPATLEQKPTLVDKIRIALMATSALGMRGTLLALATRTDTTAALATIKVPTLILVGEKDNTTPPAAAEAMHQKISGSQYYVIPNAGHYSNLENPDVFNMHLGNFVKTIP